VLGLWCEVVWACCFRPSLPTLQKVATAVQVMVCGSSSHQHRTMVRALAQIGPSGCLRQYNKSICDVMWSVVPVCEGLSGGSPQRARCSMGCVRYCRLAEHTSSYVVSCLGARGPDSFGRTRQTPGSQEVPSACQWPMLDSTFVFHRFECEPTTTHPRYLCA